MLGGKCKWKYLLWWVCFCGVGVAEVAFASVECHRILEVALGGSLRGIL